MKKFIVVSLGLMLLAVLVGIIAWLYVQNLVLQSQVPVDNNSAEVSPATTDTLKEEGTIQSTQVGDVLVTESIRLSDLPLTDAQKKAASTFGIDVDTFVITPAMISCVEIKIGESRMAQIVTGDSPSFSESLSLMGCLGS